MTRDGVFQACTIVEGYGYCTICAGLQVLPLSKALSSDFLDKDGFLRPN